MEAMGPTRSLAHDRHLQPILHPYTVFHTRILHLQATQVHDKNPEKFLLQQREQDALGCHCRANLHI